MTESERDEALPPLPAYTAPEVGMYGNHKMREYARAAQALATAPLQRRIAELEAELADTTVLDSYAAQSQRLANRLEVADEHSKTWRKTAATLLDRAERAEAKLVSVLAKLFDRETELAALKQQREGWVQINRKELRKLFPRDDEYYRNVVPAIYLYAAAPSEGEKE